MSYIGNSPSQTAFLTDQFSGTGSQTAFTMSVAPANTASCIVAVSGVLQDPTTYSVVGTTLNFTVAPPVGSGNISVRYLGIPASGITNTAYRTVTEFTATASQTTFTPPSYTVGFINVYRNGVLLGSADYTATNGTTVVLAVGCVVNDLVTVESFLVSSVLNAIPNTSGSISSSNLPAGLTITTPTINSPTLVTPALGTPSSGTLTNCTGYPASALPTGSVLQVLQTVKTDTFSSATTNSWVDITGLSVNITPSSSSNKILVLAQVMAAGAVTTNNVLLRLVRGSTAIDVGDSSSSRIPSFACTQAANDNNNANNVNASYLDSPSTTSSTTYKIQAWSNASTMYINRSPNDPDTSYAPRGASTITVMEIKG